MLRGPVLVISALACGLASMTPATARAGDKASDPEAIIDAAREFEEGRRAYRAGDFAVAAAHFEAAHRAAPRADAIRNAILARQKDKDLARAATLVAVAIARYPEDTGLAQMAKQLLPPAERRLFRVDLSCGSPCTIVADKKLAPWPDTSEAVLFFEPGKHEIAATWGRKSRTSTVEGTAGRRAPLKLTPPEDPPPPPKDAEPEPEPPKQAEPSPKSWKLPRTAFYAFGATTLVFGGITTYSAIAMRSDPGKDKVRADCAGRDRSCQTYQDALSAQRRTNVLLGVTVGAAVVTGVVGAFLTDWATPPTSAGSGQEPAYRRTETARVRVVPFVWHDGRQGTLGATGTF